MARGIMGSKLFRATHRAREPEGGTLADVDALNDQLNEAVLRVARKASSLEDHALLADLGIKFKCLGEMAQYMSDSDIEALAPNLELRAHSDRLSTLLKKIAEEQHE